MTEWITTPIDMRIVRGALELERTARGVLPHRLPLAARVQFHDEYMARTEEQPSGVRLAFRTRATAVELDVLPTKRAYEGAPPQPDGLYEFVVDGRPEGRASVPGGNLAVIDMATQKAVTRPGEPGTLRFAGLAAGAKDVEIWLPQVESAELIALRADAPVEPVPDTGRPVWLHHGSSISHGSTAAGPTSTWPAVAAARGGADLVNLGFGGNAMLDPFTARAIRDTPADLISLKIGINVANADAMRLRAFGPAVHGFLDTVREGHPDTPLLLVSPILCPVQEHTPGPLALDPEGPGLRFRATGDPAEVASGRLTLTVIRDALAGIAARRAQDDPHLHYLDGRALYGEADYAELPLPDGVHPAPETHRLIGERFAALVFESEHGAFAAR
ncbi:GDSL-type esterase/lipase family protein [Actinomadura sp. NPDC048021]|uniref:GDSL-type esterase/lipase family protein n=1 Tax=Actinomadura sp. NPDC048021 TaxID=3155385 RepID=UPI0033DBF347